MGTWDEFTPTVSPRPMRSNSVLSIDDPLPNIMVRTRRLSLAERLQLWWCGDSLSKRHWKHDVESARCDHHLCLRPFNLLIRRHHCRLCGYIFCSKCTQFTIFLDEHLKFSPYRGVPVRACKSCYRRFLEESPGCFSNY
ncbi:Zn finger protein [Dispira simplex]|nr:Zn finger protein [Dispira simplex]